MELKNNKKINFSEKTFLINYLASFHDAYCKFKVIDEHKLKITFTYRLTDDDENDTIKEIFVNFKYKMLESFSIYHSINERGVFKGKIVSNSLATDLESLAVEVYDFLFNTTDSVIMCTRQLLKPKGYGNEMFISFYNIDSIDIS